ncbi:MAG: Stk1 family PASTA domain-containing Ser/Thr kinase [Oscillospiraceae bacterium]|nr:Stk1 family PASTA domain-containing Ser/Thr kinase [Oscillospiraceae bacterium]
MNSENLVGLTLGSRYEILEKIGTGGMATVYKAKDNLLNRFVAIKVLRDSLEDEKQVVKNFIKEAQSSASLAHNNIVSVYDVGSEEELNYMVMEYVDGITLKAYIKEKGMLPWQEACDFAIQIGQGINEAHVQNIIHRDIKPQNILMTKDKILKVTDFGIAKAVASETTVVGGTALGSVHYISPEQARGEFTDARSDIYSLGIVLYEMLTGKVPFDGDTAVSVALMHLEKEPVNVRCINMEIPSDLAYITMKAISKEQHGRYQNVQEMLGDLHAVLADEPLPTRESIMDEEDDFGSLPGETQVIKIPEEKIAEADENRGRSSRKKEKQKKNKSQKRADRTASILAISTVLVIVLIAIGTFFIMNSSKESIVPDLTNMTVEEAEAELEKVGLALSDEIEYSLSDTVEENKVISQEPVPKTLVAKGESVKLIISIGASGGNIEVPDVSGKTYDMAIEEIIEAGLNYTAVEETSNLIEAGRVIRQTPIAGTLLNKNDIVTIHISTGTAAAAATTAPTERVSVPSLIGLSKEQAEATLTANGLNLGTTTRKASSSPEGTVISQSPSLGKMAAKGTYVSIVLSSGNESSTQTAAEQEEEEQNPTVEEPTDVSENYSSTGSDSESETSSGSSYYTGESDAVYTT